MGEDESVWVCSMGNLMGLFDRPWLSIPPTGKMVFMRYCEFHQVRSGKIVHTAMWFDIPQVMDQAGVNPFPPQTGGNQVQPGPMTHEGLMFGEQDPKVGEKTLKTMMKMVSDLGNWDNKLSLEEELALTWHDDMICGGQLVLVQAIPSRVTQKGIQARSEKHSKTVFFTVMCVDLPKVISEDGSGGLIS